MPSVRLTPILFLGLLHIFGLIHGQASDDKDNELVTGAVPETRKDSEVETPRKFGDIIIPKSYSKFEIPNYNKSSLGEQGIPPDVFEPFEIDVSVKIRGIGDVDELKEEVTVEMDFTATWFDTVIFGENMKDFDSDDFTDAKNLRTMDPAFLEYIWKPDLFIENVVSITRPAIIVRPIKLLFGPKTGMVVYQTRITAVIDCEMHFQYYPADTQRCEVNIRSYSHTNNEMSLVWSNKAVYILDRDEHNFDIQVSDVGTTIVTEQNVFADDSEVYDVLQFSIMARRSLSYHMIQTYLPSMFFIVITWLCFLIPVGMVEARIGVAMTTLLTLTSMFSSVRESTPIVSYIKAIDIWMVACIFFVFSTLLEFTILVFMRHGGDDAEDKSSVHSNVVVDGDQSTHLQLPTVADKSNADTVSIEDGFFVRLRKLRSRKNKSKVFENRKLTALWIEKYAFLLFFLTYVGFNLIYWPWILFASDYFEWVVDPRYNTL